MDPIDVDERLPLPSEDEGDLVEAPAGGTTDDPMVATEEGVPYAPPTRRVLGARNRGAEAPEPAGAPTDDDEELEDLDELTPSDAVAAPETDEPLLRDVLTALRRSDVTAGDRVRLAVVGSTVVVRGMVESVDIAEEVLEIVGDVPGVDEVVDELEIAGV